MNATRKTVVGVDTVKNVFQVYSVEQESGEVINKQFMRAHLLESAHEVNLMSGNLVKAFVCGKRNNAADSGSIYLAAL